MDISEQKENVNSEKAVAEGDFLETDSQLQARRPAPARVRPAPSTRAHTQHGAAAVCHCVLPRAAKHLAGARRPHCQAAPSAHFERKPYPRCRCL